MNTSSNSSKTTGQTNYYAGGITASVAWNLDFWGMYRRQTEAARANLRATEWAKQTTYATLVENVATSYYQLRTLDAELAITRSTLDARKQSLDLTQTLEQGGADSMADVRQAEELYYTAQAQIPDLERQIERQENNRGFCWARILGLSFAMSPTAPRSSQGRRIQQRFLRDFRPICWSAAPTFDVRRNC